MWVEFCGELLGTFMLIVLGNGVVANVVLEKTKGSGSGWIVITWGWGIGVFVGVFTSAAISGAHINPAVTLALAFVDMFSWDRVWYYILGQFSGAMLASVVVYLQYKDHFDETEDGPTKRAAFCTAPEIRNTKSNLLSEIIGTFILVIGVLYLAEPEVGLGAISALPVALLVLGIGLSLGGTTGYAINPARDLGPRIMHALLPIKQKANNDWGYSWIPVLGPVLGAGLAAIIYNILPF
ncbi:MAG: aquaporin [Balneola sp.]|jgi:glycerol uptake facilitator protein|nr:aquaporin [Balneola sp.]MBE77789.1 aquaporin [Balneola sp.]|tara:strand:+ start:2618 stop:3331 length:714 start_codon:yes stop_codon:yes gene_type:complete